MLLLPVVLRLIVEDVFCLKCDIVTTHLCFGKQYTYVLEMLFFQIIPLCIYASERFFFTIYMGNIITVF